MRKIGNKFFIAFFLLIGVLLTNTSNAFDIRGDVWVLSDITTNAVLKGKLKEAEFFASNKEFLEAAGSLQNVCDEYALDNFVFEGEPFNLIVNGARLWYKSRAGSFKDQSIVKEAEKLLRDYSKEAEGKAWVNYKYLYHRIRDYHLVKKEYDNVLRIQKELILYDVKDNWTVDSYLEYLRNYSLKDDSKAFFSEIEKRGGKINPRMKVLLIGNSIKDGEEGAWACLFAWFNENRKTDLETLKQGMEIVTKYIDSKNLDIAREYYITLTNLALGQVATEENMPKIAYFLNERQKLKTLIPQVAEY